LIHGCRNERVLLMCRQKKSTGLFRIGLFFLALLFFGFRENLQGEDLLKTPFTLSVQDGALTAKLTDAPLEDVLKNLARQAHLKIYLEGSLKTEKVSAEFKALPLEEGIKQILRNRNYAFTYAQPSVAGDHTETPKLLEVKVIAKDGAGLPMILLEGDMEMVPPDVEVIDEEEIAVVEDVGEDMYPEQKLINQAKEATDPVAQAEAIEALIGMGEESEVIPIILNNLRGNDPNARKAAMEMLNKVDRSSIPVESLSDIALKDPDPAFRINAMQMLMDGGGQSAEDILKQGTHDLDQDVRNWAQQVLNGLQEEGQGLQEEGQEIPIEDGLQ